MHIRFSISFCLGLTLSCALAPAMAAEQLPPAADAGAAASAPTSARQSLSPQQQMEAEFHVMAGEMAAGRDQPGLAAEAFLRALRHYPNAPLAGRTTQLALASRDHGLAKRAATRWLEIDPGAYEAREVLALVAMREGDIDSAYAHATAMVEAHPSGQEAGLRQAALILTADPSQGRSALAIFDRLIAFYPDVSGAWYAHALVALRGDQLPTAEASAQKAIALSPTARDYHLLLIGILVRGDKLEASDAQVETLAAQSSQAGRSDARISYARLLLDGGHRDRARQQFTRALEEDPDSDDARYAIGVMALTDADYALAEKMFSQLTQSEDRADSAWYQLGRVAEFQKQYEQALGHYEKVQLGELAIDAVIRKAAVLAQLGRVDQARNNLQTLRRRYPPIGPRLILAEAEILMEVKQNQEALEVYNVALAERPDDADLLYGRSLVLERLGRFPDAETDLRAMLAQNGEDSRALNALGYMLVVNTDRLEEAHKLIGSALDFAPEDPAVLDSKGWVLFKLGRVREARQWLERAQAKLQDPEIAAHLGEVLWTLGDHAEARRIWAEASERDPEHQVLLETIQRLTN